MTSRLALLLLALPLAAHAAPRTFGFTWESNVLGQGGREIESWVTIAAGRPDPYARGDVRSGFGLGVASIVDTQLYFDLSITQSGAIGQTGVLPQFTNLWKVQVSDGATAPLGFALIGAVSTRLDTVSTFPLSFEVRAVLDKQFSKVNVALNANATFGGGTPRFEQSLGLGYRLSTGFLVGLELRNRLFIKNGERYGGDAFAIGPTFSYRSKRWWLAMSLLPQVAAIKRDELNGVGDPLEMEDNERFTFRVAAGINVD